MLKTFQPTAISKPFRYAQYLAAAGLALSLAFSAAQGLKAAADSGLERTYRPIQAISHVLGSKRAIGHVSQIDRSRDLVLMVTEAVDPEVATSTTAARQRLTLQPEQTLGMNSEEGQSIDMICGPEAETLSVREGNRIGPARWVWCRPLQGRA